jgi:hypothetical protein
MAFRMNGLNRLVDMMLHFSDLARSVIGCILDQADTSCAVKAAAAAEALQLS